MWYEIVCCFDGPDWQDVYDWLLDNIGPPGLWYYNDRIVRVVTFYLRSDEEIYKSQIIAFKLMFGDLIYRESLSSCVDAKNPKYPTNTCWV